MDLVIALPNCCTGEWRAVLRLGGRQRRFLTNVQPIPLQFHQILR